LRADSCAANGRRDPGCGRRRAACRRTARQGCADGWQWAAPAAWGAYRSRAVPSVYHWLFYDTGHGLQHRHRYTFRLPYDVPPLIDSTREIASVLTTVPRSPAINSITPAGAPAPTVPLAHRPQPLAARAGPHASVRRSAALRVSPHWC